MSPCALTEYSKKLPYIRLDDIELISFVQRLLTFLPSKNLHQRLRGFRPVHQFRSHLGINSGLIIH